MILLLVTVRVLTIAAPGSVELYGNREGMKSDVSASCDCDGGSADEEDDICSW